ncbi:MAG: ABC transporter substrate-binding protein [Candidatus Omnitrophica bacterium]|nr:ABC transporter substrate-binding protein [Candidatus Omnitrophota bacterium]
MRTKTIALVFLILCLAGCRFQAGGKNPSDDTIVLSTGTDPKSFNPVIAKETSTTAITGFIFQGLTETDGVTLEVKPCLAKRWEHDGSGRIWRFFLREDVKWNDGNDFTADDVIFTFNRLIYNPDIPTSSRDVLNIDGKPFKVRKIDAHTVEFALPDKFAPFLQLMSQEILPRHKLASAVEEGVFNSRWGVNEKVENIVGTGPFMLEEYRPAEWIILKKNPLYWKKDGAGISLPYIERIVFLIIADTNMAVLKFKTGEIDLIPVRGQDYPVLKPFEKEHDFTIYEMGPSMGSEFIAFNQNIQAPASMHKKEWFGNRNFRRAVAHSIDKKSISKNVYGGFAIPQYGPMNVSSGFFNNPEIRKYAYDIEKAGEILRQESFYRKNGALFDKRGNPVEFTIITNSNNFERIQIANIVQDDLKKLGMKVNLLPVEFNTMVTQISVTRNWESVIIGLTGGIEPHGGKNVWHTDGQLHIWNMEPDEKNVASWERKINLIFEEGVKRLDPAGRKKLYDEWQEITAEELPLIYTASPSAMSAVRNRFGNLKPTVYGGALHNIEEIYIKGDEEKRLRLPLNIHPLLLSSPLEGEEDRWGGNLFRLAMTISVISRFLKKNGNVQIEDILLKNRDCKVYIREKPAEDY